MATPDTQPTEPLASEEAEETEEMEAPPHDESPPLPLLPADLQTLMREVFSLFELKDRKGEVEEKDVPTIIRGVGLNPTESQIEELLAEMRTEAAEPPKNKAPPAVTFEKLEYTLRRAVLQRPADFRRTPRETLLKALRTFDPDRRGCIEPEDLKILVMTSPAHPFSEDEARDLLQAATDSKTGKIYFDDVVELLGRDRSIGLSRLVEPMSG